ncbi:lipoprotein [Spiroplasma endosymbiont of Atherix ibis]|uniref:lipoprotein n=1 Tax=Spiroplasma endosymbiont of Atherix ibis TaxID=3066291 RepID=UPI0030CA93C5
MKKLLSLLGAVGITASTSATTVACTKPSTNPESEDVLLDNVLPETILNAYKKKNPSANINELEVFDYNQNSAQLVYKKSTSSNSKFNPIIFNYKIKALDLSDDNESLVRNILVGEMDENGVVNKSISIKDVMKNKKVTKNSIRTSFAIMNGVFLNEQDIEIGDIDYNNSRVIIKSKNQNILKGTEEVILTINKNISSDDVLKVTDIGNIYLPGSLYDNRRECFDGTYKDEHGNSVAKDNILIALPVLFQNLGDRNKLFAYLARDLFTSAVAIAGVSASKIEENMSMDNFKINLSWGGEEKILVNDNIITATDSQTVTVKFKLAKEDRLIFGEYRPNSKDFIVSKKAYSSKNIKTIVSEIYDQAGESFKNQVSKEMFTKFSTINFANENEVPTIELLPGGEYVYSFDQMAFFLVSTKLDPENDKELIKKLTPPKEGKTYGYKFVVQE